VFTTFFKLMFSFRFQLGTLPVTRCRGHVRETRQSDLTLPRLFPRRLWSHWHRGACSRPSINEAKASPHQTPGCDSDASRQWVMSVGVTLTASPPFDADSVELRRRHLGSEWRGNASHLDTDLHMLEPHGTLT